MVCLVWKRYVRAEIPFSGGFAKLCDMKGIMRIMFFTSKCIFFIFYNIIILNI